MRKEIWCPGFCLTLLIILSLTLLGALNYAEAQTPDLSSSLNIGQP